MKRRTGGIGFTLIELLVVIAIISMLMGIIMVSVSSARQKARDSKRVADLKTIQLALSLYYNDNGMYPKNIYAPAGAAPDSGLSPTYLPVVPRDPKATGTGAECATSAANAAANIGCYRYNAYTTAGSGLCNTTNLPILYHLGAAFEDTTNTALATQDVDASANLSVPYGATYLSCSNGLSPTANFDGTAPSCVGTTAVTETNCYDLTP